MIDDEIIIVAERQKRQNQCMWNKIFFPNDPIPFYSLAPTDITGWPNKYVPDMLLGTSPQPNRLGLLELHC
jgi:hypothetical protein